MKSPRWQNALRGLASPHCLTLIRFVRLHVSVFHLVEEDLTAIDDVLDAPVHANARNHSPRVLPRKRSQKASVGGHPRGIPVIAGERGLHSDVADAPVVFLDLDGQVGFVLASPVPTRDRGNFVWAVGFGQGLKMVTR